MKKKRLLYINKQYRDYDYLKYNTLANNFALTVIWICPFRESEPLPEILKAKIKYRILNFMGSRLKPRHLTSNLKLFGMVLAIGRKADIIISSTSDAWHSKIAFLANLWLRKPIAFRKEVWLNSSGKKRRVVESLTAFIEKKAKAVFYGGSMQKKILLENHLKPERLFPFPYLIQDLKTRRVDDEKVSNFLVSHRDKVKFLFLGRIIPRKGLDNLIRSFLRLSKEYQDALLLVVGGPDQREFSGENSENYYQQCRKYAQNDRIVFLDKASSHEIHNYYQCADVFVHPHKKFLNGRKATYEGWGNVVIEAASMGLALIVSDRVSSGFDLIKNYENGFIINSDCLEENLYRAMKFFLDNKEKIKIFGAKSREIYEKINRPEIIVESISSAINK